MKETLQMQTVRRQNRTDVPSSGFKSQISQVPASKNQAKRLKIREYISWSACFFVITLLTGLIKFLKLGITMESVTSTVFYLSLAGLVYFISRIYQISRTTVREKGPEVVHLN